MKFHHLARHGHQFAAHQPRDSSPSKHQQQQQQLQTSATSLHKQQQQQQVLSDEEDDDFNDTQAYYDSISDSASHLHHQPLHGQVTGNLGAAGGGGQSAASGGIGSGAANATGASQLDSSGFLMDKNKKLFPQKLWELIHNPSIQHCLRWSQDGQRVYLNRNEFEAYYLKTPNNQFHTQKAISFVRQMNMYGFRKVDDCYYENDNFRRDRQHLLRNMIRRHPNKGLFVGLDHHQLAAAAAAQQALQVNQQLQQLEHQHKHRTEQALRLNSYLNSHHHHHHQNHHHNSNNNNHHRFHHQPQHSPAHHHLSAVHHQNSNLNNHHHHHQHLQNHSASPFEHMSSQLAAAAASHLSQQQQHQHPLGQHQNINNNNNNQLPTGLNNSAGHLQAANQQQQQVSGPLQPKKSRLLSNFYASAAAAAAAAATAAASASANSTNPTCHNQDSMHSTSSVDTEPSQCSSIVNSGSAGSPQPSSPSAISLHQRLAALNAAAAVSASATNNNSTNHYQNHNQSAASLRAAVLAAQDANIQSIANRFAANASPGQQLAATDLSTRQALHQTLVRSLLQLKQQQQQQQQHQQQQQQQQQNPQDLLNSLQQQQQHNSRALLESLASLSSAGTGSIVDPTSNSPTERTGTPPSSPPSPGRDSVGGGNGEEKVDTDYLDNNNMALDLAKSSSGFSSSLKRSRRELDDDDEREHEDPIDEYPVIDDDIEQQVPEEEETEVEGDDEEEDEEDGLRSEPAEQLETAESLLNGELKRVRKYLKQEPIESPEEVVASQQVEQQQLDLRTDIDLPQKKRIKLKNNIIINNNNNTINSTNNNNNNNHDDDDDESSSFDDITVSAIARALIREICDRRGDQLDTSALQEAARYTECFLDILLNDAVLIARHSSSAEMGDHNDEVDSPDHGNNSDGCDKDSESSSLKGSSIRNNSSSSSSSRREGIVDPSSLSLALKLIPSKLLVAIQQQVSINKSQALTVVGGLN